MADTDKKQPEEGFVIIHINKDKTSGPVRGGVNGRTYEVAVGSDQTVPQWVARSIADTQINFSIVAGDLGEPDGEGGAEGSAPSSTVTRTAIRGETPEPDGVAGTPMPAANLSAEAPVLGQVGGAQGAGGTARTSASEGTTAPAPPAPPSPPSDAGGEKQDESGKSESFDADAFIDRTLDEISDDELAALTPEQRAAVRKAEEDREEPRVGLTGRLDKLDQPGE